MLRVIWKNKYGAVPSATEILAHCCRKRAIAVRCERTGFDPRSPTKRSSAKKIKSLSGLWWISGFGIIGGFFLVGGWEYKREFDQGSAASHFSLALLTIIALSWSAFLVFDGKARKREPMVVDVLTAMGTLLAIVTLLGIFFFVQIVPRVR